MSLLERLRLESSPLFNEVSAELERLIVKNAVLQRYSYYTRHAALEEAAVLCDKSFIHTGKDIAAAVRNLKHKEPLI